MNIEVITRAGLRERGVPEARIRELIKVARKSKASDVVRLAYCDAAPGDHYKVVAVRTNADTAAMERELGPNSRIIGLSWCAGVDHACVGKPFLLNLEAP